MDGLTSFEKSISATAGSILTSLIVTPFDVVKVRIQSQISSAKSIKPLGYVYCSEFFDHVKPISGNRVSILEAAAAIVKNEGVFRLWRGLFPTLIMSIPATTIYYVGYDELKTRMQYHLPSKYSYVAPLLSGGISRAIAVSCISPLELVRTRVQSSSLSIEQILDGIYLMIREKGFTSLWRGLEATLWRDVPFSAIYWMGYEFFKEKLSIMFDEKSNSVDNFLLSFSSGALSGMISAAITTPFDVAKTIKQVHNTHMDKSVFAQLKIIWENEGIHGLHRGMIPRIAKVAPACAIMISSYEMGKSYFSTRL